MPTPFASGRQQRISRAEQPTRTLDYRQAARISSAAKPPSSFSQLLGARPVNYIWRKVL